MNLARIKLMALLLHALCNGAGAVSLLKLADAMPTTVDKDSQPRTAPKDSFAKYVLDALDIIARMSLPRCFPL